MNAAVLSTVISMPSACMTAPANDISVSVMLAMKEMATFVPLQERQAVTLSTIVMLMPIASMTHMH